MSKNEAAKKQAALPRVAWSQGRERLRRWLAAVASLILLSGAMSGCGQATAPRAEQAAAPRAGQAAAPRDEQAAPANVSWSPLHGSGLFDASEVHEISVVFAQDEYETMIQTYRETGEKDWIKGTVTIDGKLYCNVGLRLKGNSSLMYLRGRGPGALLPGARGQGPAKQDENALSQAVEPETLPWLIDLDRYVDGQNHYGVAELVVRSNNTATALNEAVALFLLRETGLASQDVAYVRFDVNGSQPRLRLVIENPDDLWMAKNFDISGALYKAESSGDYSYRGQDPQAYDEVFDQEAGKKNTDLTPLVDFLYFLNTADDQTFSAELPERLDIYAFADYLAFEDLIGNFDDIDGPGNNSYLYYNPKTGRFTVVAWDHNLAFGMGMGKGREGLVVNPAAKAGGDGRPGQGPFGAGRPGPRGRSNVLVERFKANPEWVKLYEERLEALKNKLCASGLAAEVLDYWVQLLSKQADDLVAAGMLEAEASQISAYFSNK